MSDLYPNANGYWWLNAAPVRVHKRRGTMQFRRPEDGRWEDCTEATGWNGPCMDHTDVSAAVKAELESILSDLNEYRLACLHAEAEGLDEAISRIEDRIRRQHG